MKTKLFILFIVIVSILAITDSIEKRMSSHEIVMSLDKDVHEFILLQLDDTSDSNIVEYYKNHRATCDSVLTTIN